MVYIVRPKPHLRGLLLRLRRYAPKFIGIAESGPEWHAKVYQPSTRRMIPSPIKARVRQRDGYKCQVKVCGARRTLDCHHIIPDAEGGPTIESNLILLCQKCHDEIEETALRTRSSISDYEPEWYMKKNKIKPKTEPEKPPIDRDADWHLWVYGGARNPWK